MDGSNSHISNSVQQKNNNKTRRPATIAIVATASSRGRRKRLPPSGIRLVQQGIINRRPTRRPILATKQISYTQHRTCKRALPVCRTLDQWPRSAIGGYSHSCHAAAATTCSFNVRIASKQMHISSCQHKLSGNPAAVAAKTASQFYSNTTTSRFCSGKTQLLV